MVLLALTSRVTVDADTSILLAILPAESPAETPCAMTSLFSSDRCFATANSFPLAAGNQESIAWGWDFEEGSGSSRAGLAARARSFRQASPARLNAALLRFETQLTFSFVPVYPVRTGLVLV